MDTREKIVTVDEMIGAVNEDGWTVVAGLFDPLTAVEAKRLTKYAQSAKLGVIVVDEPNTLLPATARASLVAALASVSFVAVGHSGWRDHFPYEFIEDVEGDMRRRDEFVNIVSASGQRR